MCRQAILKTGLLLLVFLIIPRSPILLAEKELDSFAKEGRDQQAMYLETHQLLKDAVVAFARDPDNSKESLSIVDQDLLHFCQLGRLVSRGMANSFMLGTTDAWIVRHALHDEAFAEALEVTQEQLKRTELEDARYFAPPTTEDLANKALTKRDRAPGWGYHRWLKEHLTADQHDKLPQIYLHIEGLTALRRPVYRDLIGVTLEEQKTIVNVVDEYEKRNFGGHQVIQFTAPDERYMLAIVESALRWQSANLDLKILVLLSREQREQLYGLFKDEWMFEDIEGPGSYQDRGKKPALPRRRDAAVYNRNVKRQ